MQVRTLAIGIAIVLSTGILVLAQTGSALFERARLLELVQGDLEGAIELYEQIVRDFPSDRSLAAQALVQLGESYDKLGDARARSYFERIVEEYGDQSVPAARARAWLDRAPVLPKGAEVAMPYSSFPYEIAISPNGRYLVVQSNQTVSGELWRHDLETGEAGPLPGTEGAGATTHPFWSPDSRSVAFFVGGKLKRIDVDGTNLQVLADAHTNWGGAWSPEGVIVFRPSFLTPGFFRIPADGSRAPVILEATEDYNGRYPQFLPDGRFLFLDGSFVIATLDGRHAQRLPRMEFPTRGHSVIAGDHRIFVNDGRVMARRSDLATLTPIGEPLLLAEANPAYQPLFGNNGLSAAAAGPVAYRTATPVAREFVWTDRSGEPTGTLGHPDSGVREANARIGPGGRVTFNRGPGFGATVWVFEAGENDLPVFRRGVLHPCGPRMERRSRPRR